MEMNLSYGRGYLPLPKETPIKAVLSSCLHELHGGEAQGALVEQALQNSIASAPLFERVMGKQKILVITSDHTRPVPSKITMPIVLQEIRRGSPDAEIVILVATGVHRGTTKSELCGKFGEEIVSKEDVRVHDAFDQSELSEKGILPSGCRFSVNSLVDWADFIVAEGFIEPHFFAGFSGGRKSILPGIASATSVMSNHCARLIAAPNARTGVLDDNPIHADMLYAAKLTGLSYILNVVIDSEKRIVAAYAGDLEQAHQEGCAFVKKMCSVPVVEGDIVLTTNGGYPLDQNVYQAVKSMTAAEACVRPDGVIICVSKCEDGSGGEEFFRWFQKANGPADVMEKIMKISPEDTIADQWQAQILARIMLRASVIMVADDCAKDTIEGMGMIYCATVEEALQKAVARKPDHDGVVVIPDGVSVIIEE